MARELPKRASVENLKNQAKTLLKQFKRGEPEAVKTIGKYFGPTTPIGLKRVHLVLAREYGFDSWLQMMDAVNIPPPVEASLASALTSLFAESREVGREVLTPESLIIAILNDNNVQELLAALKCNSHDLRAALEPFVGDNGAAEDPLNSVGIQAVVQQAIFNARSDHREQTRAIDVLYAFLQSDSPAVGTLHQQGISQATMDEYLHDGRVSQETTDSTRADVGTLLKEHVPSVANASVEVIDWARLPRVGTKIAVKAVDPAMDPVEACSAHLNALRSALGDEQV